MFLGIDIGTSAVKVLLTCEDEKHLFSASSPLTLNSPHSGWMEQNPDDWWQAIIHALSSLARQEGVSLNKISAIGLSGQMHGAVLLDRHQQVLHPAILWNDGRAEKECMELEARCPQTGTLAGVRAMPGFTAPKVMWLKTHKPDIYHRIAHILLPKDYIRLKLCGTFGTDHSDAAGSLWFDEKSRNWSTALCKASDTPLSWLPPLHQGCEQAGTLTQQAASSLGLPANIPVAAGAGDAAAGAMGIGVINEGEAFLSLGTSGQLFVATSHYSPCPEHYLHTFAHCIPERWFQMAAMLNGASPLQWFANTANKSLPALLAEAQAIKADDSLLFLPYLTGERSPYNDPRIRGTFYGLTPATTDTHMMRAVVDAVAYSFCLANDAIKTAGTSYHELGAIGGGSQSNFVLQTLADALGHSVIRYKDASTGPALGAARLAMIASGAKSISQAATKPAIDRDFQPDPARQDYHQARQTRHIALYNALKPFAYGA